MRVSFNIKPIKEGSQPSLGRQKLYYYKRKKPILKRNYILVEGTIYTEKDQNCDTRSQVKEELCQHLEGHCESVIDKPVKKKITAVFDRAKLYFKRSKPIFK